jgi:hypothetical protein
MDPTARHSSIASPLGGATLTLVGLPLSENVRHLRKSFLFFRRTSMRQLVHPDGMATSTEDADKVMGSALVVTFGVIDAVVDAISGVAFACRSIAVDNTSMTKVSGNTAVI